jgi:hypothetical protein
MYSETTCVLEKIRSIKLSNSVAPVFSIVALLKKEEKDGGREGGGGLKAMGTPEK